jgi:hypothetical protein
VDLQGRIYKQSKDVNVSRLVSVVWQHDRRPLGALHDDLQWTYLERDNLNMLMSHLVDELAVEVAVEEAVCLLAC